MLGRTAILIVLSGLPGTGKTTIAKALVAELAAAYVRVDAIEHALKQQRGSDHDIGDTGYIVAFALAASNLELGNVVVADSVNPVPESRQSWRSVVRSIEGVRLVEVEAICSDIAEHRRRVEERASDIVCFTLPSWSSVISHDYVPWTEPRLIVDTATLGVAEAVSLIRTQLLSTAESLHSPC